MTIRIRYRCLHCKAMVFAWRYAEDQSYWCVRCALVAGVDRGLFSDEATRRALTPPLAGGKFSVSRVEQPGSSLGS